MTSSTKGLVERLEDAANSGFYNHRASQRPYTQSDAQRDKEAATAIKLAADIMREHTSECPACRTNIADWFSKYQPEDK